jgi:serine/threonine protein kinase
LKRGGKPSKESDVYAFGMILWEMTTRKIPYEDAADDTVALRWIESGEKETIPEKPAEHPATCQRAYPVYAALITRCWEERSKRPTIQVAAEELRPLKAEEAATSTASGPVQLDNFASAIPK